MRQFCNGDIGREYFNIGIKVRTALKVGGAGGGVIIRRELIGRRELNEIIMV